jgi:hypothetical protein
MKNQFINFSKISGAMLSKLTEEEIFPIQQEIEKIKSQILENKVKYLNFNSTLAGNILHEYKLIQSEAHLENIVYSRLKEFENHFKYIDNKLKLLSKPSSLILKNCWVNFQKKYEFNPPHNHSGVISFVIWVKIPYNIQDEIEHVSCKNALRPLAGHFQFITTSIG